MLKKPACSPALVLSGDAQERHFEGTVAWCHGNQAGIELSLTPTEEALIQQSIDHLLETQGFLKFFDALLQEIA